MDECSLDVLIYFLTDVGAPGPQYLARAHLNLRFAVQAVNGFVM